LLGDSLIPVSKDTVPENTIEEKEDSGTGLESPFEYVSADSTELLLNDQKIKLYKNAQINYESIELKAEHIVLDMETKTIVAYGKTDTLGQVYGKPLFKDGGEEFEADTIIYNFETKKGLIKGVFTKQGEGYLHSKVNKKMGNNEICLKNGKYTTCDHEHPHFYLALSKAKVIPEDKIVSGPAYLVIEDIILPIGIPFGFFPNTKGGASGVIIPGYGDDLGRGFFLRDGGYYFYINDYLDTKVLGEIYSNGSWGIGNETRYAFKYRFNGQFSGKYSKFIKKADEPGRQENITYNFKWRHTQDPKANPYSRLSADVNFGSAKYKQFNSTTQNDRLSTNQSSSIAYSRKMGNSPFNLSINARQNQKTNLNAGDELGKMDITLPEANLSMSRIYPFKRKKRVGKELWYEKIGISYNGSFKNMVTGIDEDTLWTDYTLTQFKNGVQHRVPISTSIKALKFLNINPNITLTERWHFKSLHRSWNADSGSVDIDTLNGFARAGDFNISVPLTTKLYGMYQVVGKDPILKAVRHVVTPSVSFSWRPDFGEERWGIYQHIYNENDSLIGVFSKFQGGSYTTYNEEGKEVSNPTWSGLYGSPARGKSGMVSFNLNNNFEMKVRNRKDTVKGSKNIKLLDRLSFNTSYNMAVDTMNWSKLKISAGTQIAKILTIDMGMTVDPYDYNKKTGKSINRLLWKEGELGRLTNANLSSGITISSKGLKNERKTSSMMSTEEQEAYRSLGFSDQMIDMGYADFSMPWSLTFRYSINYSNTQFNVETFVFDESVTQTMNINGHINLTKGWKINFRSGWDFQKEELSYTTFTFVRDLHCWQMSFNWVPFGAYQSYYFRINVKSAMLQDLKYEQRRSWLEDI
jgi:hypothetical protein